MIAMVAVFGMFLLLFAFIGSVRGWAKEVLVIISVILALAVISLFEDLLNLEAILFNGNTTLQYWFRTLTVGLLVLFGYQSPSLPRLQKAIEKRGKIQDNILGFFFGIFSGYFVMGTLWSFSSQAMYPMLDKYVQAVPPELSDITERVLNLLPPMWLDEPVTIFISVVVSFIFAIIYFL